MRKLFSSQLIEARHEMLSIFEAIDLTLHDAVDAFVNDDRELARRAQNKTLKIDARCVYRVLGATASALVNNDLATVLTLSEEDEAVHGAYQEFFRVFNRTETMEVADDAQMDDFRRTVMVSRYLDRVASISMECAYRLVFLLTGQRWSADDIAEADEDELESLRIPSGEGVTLDPESDARFVSHLALDEVGHDLATLIAELAE